MSRASERGGAVPAPGEVDLDVLLATLDVHRRPGTFTYVEVPRGRAVPADAAAMVDEDGVVAAVVPAGSPSSGGGVFEAAWLTLTVESSLEAVGLTAAVCAALAARGIPANVLAGLRHDHVLVPADRADDAVATLRDLAASRHP